MKMDIIERRLESSILPVVEDAVTTKELTRKMDLYSIPSSVCKEIMLYDQCYTEEKAAETTKCDKEW